MPIDFKLQIQDFKARQQEYLEQIQNLEKQETEARTAILKLQGAIEFAQAIVDMEESQVRDTQETDETYNDTPH